MSASDARLFGRGRNSAGPSTPRRGWRQRGIASKPATVRSSSRTIGWNSTMISPRCQRVAQIGRRARRAISRAARMSRCEHHGAVAARLLGVGQRDLGVAEQVGALGVERAVERARGRSSAVTATSRSPKLIGLASCLRSASPNAAGSTSASRITIAPNWSPPSRASVSPGFRSRAGAARDRQQRGIAERQADARR